MKSQPVARRAVDLATLALPALCAAAVFALSLASVNIQLIAVFAVVVVAGFAVMSVDAATAFKLYFLILLFEGVAKVWSNYNPVVHVSSDLLLLVVTGRLWARRHELPPPPAAVRRRLARVGGCLMIFWLWVLVQFVNPWGLGIVPSLASLKVYLLPVLAFYCAALLLREEELRPLPAMMLAMGLFEGVLAIVDWSFGDSGVPSLHPYYANLTRGAYSGPFYRPFGTTALPGGPAMWMFHCTMAGLAWLAQQRQMPPQSSWRLWLPRVAVATYVPVSIAALFICQVRSILVRAVILIVVGLAMQSRAWMLGTAAVSMVGGLVVAQQLATPQEEDPTEVVSASEQVAARSLSLTSGKTWANARSGAWEASMRLARYTWLGIGLSRTGASSGPWSELIRRDRMFGLDFSFADNLFRAIFTEVGIFGLIAWGVLMLVLLHALATTGTYTGKLVGIYLLLLLLTGFASEGILYQPDASLFWFWAAFGLRSA